MRDFIHKAFGHESFLKNILLLVSGTLLAQVISFLASPVLTRLYSPASYVNLAYLRPAPRLPAR